MEQFNFTIPTRVYFGKEVTDDALNQECKLLEKKILIVTTGRSLIRLGYLDKIVEKIKKNGSNQIFVYSNVSQNPQLEEVKSAIEYGKNNNVEVIIGFGGGSAIDAAKAVAVGVAADEVIDRYYFEGKEPPKNTLPIIAIPTTAGTGTELSKAAIISSKAHSLKAGIRGDYILPTVAIVDTFYTFTVPKSITMETGFDALAHGIETYVAEKSNLFSEMISEKIIKSIGVMLPALNSDLADEEARTELCFSSMIAGVNLANVGTCFPHRMQYVVASLTETNHSEGLIALYPSWIKYQYGVNANKINNVLEWLNLPRANTGEEAKQYFQQFLKKISVEYTLSSLGVKKSEVTKMHMMVTGNLGNDKLSQDINTLKWIFEESL